MLTTGSCVGGCVVVFWEWGGGCVLGGVVGRGCLFYCLAADSLLRLVLPACSLCYCQLKYLRGLKPVFVVDKTYVHPCLGALSHSLKHAHTRTLTRSLARIHTHTHTRACTHAHTLPLSMCVSLSLSHTHTRTRCSLAVPIVVMGRLGATSATACAPPSLCFGTKS